MGRVGTSGERSWAGGRCLWVTARRRRITGIAAARHEVVPRLEPLRNH